MKYKTYLLFALALGLLTLLSACAGPRLLNEHGDSLTFPRSDPAVSIDKAWVNTGTGPFFVGPENESRIEILPGTSHTFHRRSDREERWTIVFPRKKGVNETLDELELTRTGVFPGDVIYVDDFFLRGKVPQLGVIMNKEVCSFHVTDDRNNDYGILYPGQSTKIRKLQPGPVTFYAYPLENCYGGYSGGVRSYYMIIDDNPDNVIWVDDNGVEHLLGWNVFIYPNQR